MPYASIIIQILVHKFFYFFLLNKHVLHISHKDFQNVVNGVLTDRTFCWGTSSNTRFAQNLVSTWKYDHVWQILSAGSAHNRRHLYCIEVVRDWSSAYRTKCQICLFSIAFVAHTQVVAWRQNYVCQLFETNQAHGLLWTRLLCLFLSGSQLLLNCLQLHGVLLLNLLEQP